MMAQNLDWLSFLENINCRTRLWGSSGKRQSLALSQSAYYSRNKTKAGEFESALTYFLLTAKWLPNIQPSYRAHAHPNFHKILFSPSIRNNGWIWYKLSLARRLGRIFSKFCITIELKSSRLPTFKCVASVTILAFDVLRQYYQITRELYWKS